MAFTATSWMTAEAERDAHAEFANEPQHDQIAERIERQRQRELSETGGQRPVFRHRRSDKENAGRQAELKQTPETHFFPIGGRSRQPGLVSEVRAAVKGRARPEP